MFSFTQAHNDYLDPDIHNPSDESNLTPDGADPDMAKLLDETFGREGLQGWKKSAYKGTDCGAWLELRDPVTIEMGSIVEGVEECSETHTLTFPFEEKQVWDALDAIEKDCERIWNETHGCEDCYPVDEETMYIPVNPECKTCGGDGIVI